MQIKQLAKVTPVAILLTLASATAAFGQKGTIKGTVVDADNGTPLAGTTIIIEGTTIGSVADAEGGFVISNITPGRVSITASYLGYEVFRQELAAEADLVTTTRIPLHSSGVSMERVVVFARINNESENVLLSGQREALMAVWSVGAAEMSRKGIGDARAAAVQVAGVSGREGAGNVFVRGLGDRYNATTLNGFALPSENPEYKNIALEFFGSDVIKNIGVNKVFSASTGGDVGGAVIDIRSKELFAPGEMSVSIDGGVTGAAVAGGVEFMKQDGVSRFGVSRATKPTPGTFDFANSLDPRTVHMPLNHGYGISGGKRWTLGAARNPLAFFAVASHAVDHSFTDETVRKGTSNGDILLQDQQGRRSTVATNQLVLGNVDLRIDRRYAFTYNFLLVHANDQYVGQYEGRLPELNQGTDNGMVFLRRQQSNDNLLLTHQLSTVLNLTDRLQINLGAARNTICGLEPDRRENYLSMLDDGRYVLVAGNRQKRFFSRLDENDFNLKTSVRFKLKQGRDIEKSNLTLGYRGRLVDDGFRATEYNIGAAAGFFRPDELRLDEVYNTANHAAGKFTVSEGKENRYDVSKNIHSFYLEATHQFSERFAANAGVQFDNVDMAVDYDVDAHAPGVERIDRRYWLPSLSLRYDPAERHSLRFGASRSYTLPQSKEIAPYQYVNIGFVSEGNPGLKPSDNYNVDVKWDWYPSGSELVSMGAFYKYIANPIGRVDVGGSAGILSYDNISPRADVAGVELEIRKNIFNTVTIRKNMRRLSFGINASYIFSDMEFAAENTLPRHTKAEGTSPWLVNGDLSYNWSSGERSLNVSMVADWFSDRIHTLGTRGYNDTVEEGVVTLSFVSSYRFNDRISIKFKAENLLNPTRRLTREYANGRGRMILNEYRKGIDVSAGVSFDLW